MSSPFKTFALIVVFALTTLSTVSASASVATYRLTVVNDWTSAGFPINFPGNDHWTAFGGGTHSTELSFWSVGGIASSQMESMAEGGNAVPLRNQISSAGGSPLLWNYWFCRPDSMAGPCGPTVVEFTIDSNASALTLNSMIAPSPDWFIGVSALNLYPNGAWTNSLVVPLAMYDAGTEEGLVPTLSNPPTSPQEPISRITYNTVTGDYELSATQDIVGSFTFELLSVEDDPDADGDGIGDSFDNCTALSNTLQVDTDGDGYGNACDADVNNDCVVNFLDVAQFSDVFLTSTELFDFNGDGVVNFLDLSILANSFLSPPGPAAGGNCTIN